MGKSNFPTSLDYPDSTSYFSDLSSEDWKKIKRYNSLLQKDNGLTDDEQSEIEKILSSLQGKHITADDINKIIDCIRNIEIAYFDKIKGHTHKKSDITDFPTTMKANGGNADTVDGKHASEFLSVNGGTVSGDLVLNGELNVPNDNEIHFGGTVYGSDADFGSSVSANAFIGDGENITNVNAVTVGGFGIDELMKDVGTFTPSSGSPEDFNDLRPNTLCKFQFVAGTSQSGFHTPLGDTETKATWYNVLTFGEHDNRITQIATLPYSHQRETYIRYKHDSTWSDWKKINDGGNAKTLNNKTSDDFATASHTHTLADITDYTSGSSTGTNNGNADTVDGKHAKDFVNVTEDGNIKNVTGLYNNVPVAKLGTIKTDTNATDTIYSVLVVEPDTDGFYTYIAFPKYKSDVYIYNSFIKKWIKIDTSGNAKTLNGKSSDNFFQQGNVWGTDYDSEDTVSILNGYNNIIGGKIDFGNEQHWGFSLSKESDYDGIAPALFVGEERNVFSYNLYGNGDINNFSTDRRTLSIGAPATVVIAASDTLPANIKFSADYICSGTNDQNTIKSAINSLSDNGGKIILLNGTYNITGSINIAKPNIFIEGMGNSTIFSIVHTTSMTSLKVFTVDGSVADNFTIKNLSFNMTSLNNTAYKSYFISVTNELVNATIDKISGNSVNECNFIYLEEDANISTMTISNCDIFCQSYSRIKIGNESSEIRILNNNFYSALQCPVYIENSNHIMLSNNIISSSGTVTEKLILNNLEKCICTNNIIHNGITQSNNTNCVIENNI